MRKSKLALKGLVGGAGVVLLILFTISTKPASALFWETTIPSEMPPVDYTPFLNSSDNPLDILNQIFWGATETGSPPPPPISFDQLQDVPTVTFSNPESAVSDFVTNFLKIADLKGLTSAENNIWYLNYANKYHYFYYDTTTNTLNYVSYSVPSQGSTISVILWKYKKIGVDGKGPYGSGKGGWFLMGKTEETNTSITDGELRLLSNPRGLLVEFGNDEQNFSEKFDIKKQGENGYYIYGLVNRFDGDFISDVYDYTTGLILVKKEGRNLFDADDWYYNYNKNTVVRYKKNDQGEITDLEAKTFQKLPDSDPKKIGIDPLEGQSPQIDLEKAKLDTIKKKIEYALGLPEGGLTNEAFLDALLKANYKDNYIFELDVNGQHLLFNLKSDGTINRYIKFNPDNTITVYQPIESGQDYSIVLNNTLFDKIKDHIADLGSDNNLVDLILSGKLELNYDYKRLITKDKDKNKFFWAFDVDETGSLQFISSIREGQSRLFITDSAGKLIVEIFNIPPEAGTGKAILSNFEFNPEDKKFSLRVGNFIRVYNLSPYIGREVDLSKPKSELPYEEKPVIDIEALGEEGRAFLQQILGMSTEEVKSMLESGNFELKNDYLIVKKANGEIYIFDYRKDGGGKNVLKTDYYYSLNNQGLSIKRGELVPQHTGGFKFRVEGTITLADKTTLDNIMKILGIAKGQPVSLDALAGLIDFSQLDPTNIWEDGKFKVEKIQLGISFDIDQKIDGNDRFVVINLLSSEDKKSLRLNSAAIGYAEEISEGGQTKTLITKIEVYDGTGILKFALGDREKIKAIFDGEVTPQNAIDKLKLINYDSQSGTVEINGFIFKTDAAGTASTDVAFKIENNNIVVYQWKKEGGKPGNFVPVFKLEKDWIESLLRQEGLLTDPAKHLGDEGVDTRGLLRGVINHSTFVSGKLIVDGALGSGGEAEKYIFIGDANNTSAAIEYISQGQNAGLIIHTDSDWKKEEANHKNYKISKAELDKIISLFKYKYLDKGELKEGTVTDFEGLLKYLGFDKENGKLILDGTVEIEEGEAKKKVGYYYILDFKNDRQGIGGYAKIYLQEDAKNNKIEFFESLETTATPFLELGNEFIDRLLNEKWGGITIQGLLLEELKKFVSSFEITTLPSGNKALVLSFQDNRRKDKVIQFTKDGNRWQALDFTDGQTPTLVVRWGEGNIELNSWTKNSKTITFSEGNNLSTMLSILGKFLNKDGTPAKLARLAQILEYNYNTEHLILALTPEEEVDNIFKGKNLILSYNLRGGSLINVIAISDYVDNEGNFGIRIFPKEYSVNDPATLFKSSPTASVHWLVWIKDGASLVGILNDTGIEPASIQWANVTKEHLFKLAQGIEYLEQGDKKVLVVYNAGNYYFFNLTQEGLSQKEREDNIYKVERQTIPSISQTAFDLMRQTVALLLGEKDWQKIGWDSFIIDPATGQVMYVPKDSLTNKPEDELRYVLVFNKDGKLLKRDGQGGLVEWTEANNLINSLLNDTQKSLEEKQKALKDFFSKEENKKVLPLTEAGALFEKLVEILRSYGIIESELSWNKFKAKLQDYIDKQTGQLKFKKIDDLGLPNDVKDKLGLTGSALELIVISGLVDDDGDEHIFYVDKEGRIHLEKVTFSAGKPGIGKHNLWLKYAWSGNNATLSGVLTDSNERIVNNVNISGKAEVTPEGKLRHIELEITGDGLKEKGYKVIKISTDYDWNTHKRIRVAKTEDNQGVIVELIEETEFAIKSDGSWEIKKIIRKETSTGLSGDWSKTYVEREWAGEKKDGNLRREIVEMRKGQEKHYRVQTKYNESGKPIEKTIEEKDGKFEAKVIEKALEGDLTNGEVEVYGPDGTDATRILYKDGKPQRVIKVGGKYKRTTSGDTITDTTEVDGNKVTLTYTNGRLTAMEGVPEQEAKDLEEKAKAIQAQLRALGIEVSLETIKKALAAPAQEIKLAGKNIKGYIITTKDIIAEILDPGKGKRQDIQIILDENGRIVAKIKQLIIRSGGLNIATDLYEIAIFDWQSELEAKIKGGIVRIDNLESLLQSRNFSELDLDSLKFDENKSRATFIKEGDRLVLKEYHIEGSGNIAYVLQQQQGSATIWISSTYEDINISNATYNYTQVVKWEVQGYYSSEQKITASGVVEDDGRIKAQKVTTEENKNFDQPQGGFKYTKLIEKETKELQEDGKFLETAKTVTFEKENGDKIEITYAYYKNGKPQRREITETSGGVTATRTEIVESGSFESGKIKISGKWINPSTGKVEEIGEKTVTRSSTQLTAELAKQLGLPEDLVGSLIAIDLSNEFTVGQASQEELDEIKKALFIAYLVTQVGLKIESEEDMKKLDSAYQALMSGDIDGALNALGLSLNEQQKAALIKILEEIKNNLSGTEINNVKVQEQVIYDAKTGKIIKRSYKYVSGLPPLKTTQQQTQNANQGPTAQGTASTGPGGGAGPSKVSEDTNLPSTGMRSPGERAKREINSALSNFRKIAAKGNVEEILNYLREQGFVDSLSQVHIGKLSRFKNQRVARGYKLAQTVMQKFKEILKTQGKEKAKAYLKKLGLSDAVIEKVFGSADNPMSEEEAIKRAQAVLMGATDEEIEKVAKGELSLEELAKKYKLPDSVVEKIMNLTDATEAWGILLLNVKDETGNLALENVETIQNILNILEEEKPSEDKYNEISQIMQEVLELSESEVQELIGSSPAQLLQSTLYKYDQKQAALDYFKQETGFSDFTAQLITTGNAEGLDGLLDRIAEVINAELGGKITQKEWDAKKDKLITGLMKALFNGRLTPDADVEGIVKEIIAEVNFKFTASPEESPAPSNLIDRENLRGRIGIDLINNPQEQAVRKQGTELGSSESYRKKEEEKKLRELIEKIRAISAP